MSCFNPMPLYANPPFRGLRLAASLGDGYTVRLNWYKAIPDRTDYTLAYNLYYSSIREDVFTEGIKYVVIDPNQVDGYIRELKPGDVYYFAVRATEFESSRVNLSQLPMAEGYRTYPAGELLTNMAFDSTYIHVRDVELFPNYGIVQVGAEIIGYSSRDLVDGYLITSVAERGLYGTEPRLHTTDGYDGVRWYDDPLVNYFKGFEDDNVAVETEHNAFDAKYAWNSIDGYKAINNDGILGIDPQPVEDSQEDFLRYCFSGYRRTHPADLLAGKCIGTYYGGEQCCADGYDGVARRIRGLTFQDHNNQREEILLETTGEPVVLVRRQWSGNTSIHYTNTRENTAYRGLDNHGTHMVTGYEQFFNSRRSDGRIMVRFGPAKEDLIRTEAGLESEMTFECWTMAFPPIRDSDFLIRFYEDGAEEFRYEVIDVTRNKTVLLETGAQKFTVKRVRKTDPIYQFGTIRDTSTIPTDVYTSLAGNASIVPHLHRVRINEGIVTLSQINQTTSINEGHNHPVRNGVVEVVLGHSHDLMLP